jgi:hypothetical protein
VGHNNNTTTLVPGETNTDQHSSRRGHKQASKQASKGSRGQSHDTRRSFTLLFADMYCSHLGAFYL